MGSAFVSRLALVSSFFVGPACAGSPRGGARQAIVSEGSDDRARTMAFANIEEETIGWLVAADPRLAARAGATAPPAVLKRIGMDAILQEDTTAEIRDNSLDLFAFRARQHALEEAARAVSSFRETLPEMGPAGSPLARPKLERELLERLIAEERARALEEATLGNAAGELVRAIVSTWTQPATPREWRDRDAWVSKHLLEIRESLRDSAPPTGPSDLDVALYPLERLLAPLQFPRGSAAIAAVRMALDADMRQAPSLDAPSRVAGEAKLHLGVTIDPASLPLRIELIEQRLRELAEAALATRPDRPEVEARARELLLVERPCPGVRGTRVRTMAPPPERSAICGVLSALADGSSSAAALVALHDDVVLAFSSVTTVPPPRAVLLSQPDAEDVNALKRGARERPVPVLGVALAAELIYGLGAAGDAGDRVGAWRSLGEAPLDIVAREVGAKPTSN